MARRWTMRGTLGEKGDFSQSLLERVCPHSERREPSLTRPFGGIHVSPSRSTLRMAELSSGRAAKSAAGLRTPPTAAEGRPTKHAPHRLPGTRARPGEEADRR